MRMREKPGMQWTVRRSFAPLLSQDDYLSSTTHLLSLVVTDELRAYATRTCLRHDNFGARMSVPLEQSPLSEHAVATRAQGLRRLSPAQAEQPPVKAKGRRQRPRLKLVTAACNACRKKKAKVAEHVPDISGAKMAKD